mgnify:FL=1
MKRKGIFDCLADISYKKTDINTYTENDWKVYNPYMIHRFLSMKEELIGIMNLVQKYYTLDKKTHYVLMSDILPKQKLFAKYIKGKKVDKFNPELVDLMAKHYEIGRDEAKQRIEMFLHFSTGKQSITDILEGYGKTKKEIKGLLK